MPPDPDAVLRRLTDRLAPLERDLVTAASGSPLGPAAFLTGLGT
jgi:hypothetical protein